VKAESRDVKRRLQISNDLWRRSGPGRARCSSADPPVEREGFAAKPPAPLLPSPHPFTSSA